MTTDTTWTDTDGRPRRPSYGRPDRLRTTPAVRIRIYTVATVAGDIMHGLSDIVDGGTVHYGHGWWTDPATGVVDTETSVTMDIVTTPDRVDIVSTVAATAARVAGETCIMVTVDPTDMAMIWTDGRTEDTVTVDPIPAVIRDMAAMVDGAS